MIDDLIMVMEINPPESVQNYSQIPFDWRGFTFSPLFRLGEVTKYVGEFRNLRLVIYSNTLVVSGSLHKFYHGKNSGDFTWLEIRDSLEQLSEAFGEALEVAQLKKLTFACNLPVDAKPFLDRLISIRGRMPVNMLGGINHTSYGKYIKLTHARIKIYDKKSEVFFHDRRRINPSLRLEIELNLKAAASRKTNPLELWIPSDMLESRFASYCQQELLTLVNQLEFTQDLLPNYCTSASDLECLALMKDMETRLSFKKLANPKTHRKKLKRYLELCAEIGSNDLKQNLLNLVEDKIKELTIVHQTLRKIG
jgi:hypothetical protein